MTSTTTLLGMEDRQSVRGASRSGVTKRGQQNADLVGQTVTESAVSNDVCVVGGTALLPPIASRSSTLHGVWKGIPAPSAGERPRSAVQNCSGNETKTKHTRRFLSTPGQQNVSQRTFGPTVTGCFSLPLAFEENKASALPVKCPASRVRWTFPGGGGRNVPLPLDILLSPFKKTPHHETAEDHLQCNLPQGLCRKMSDTKITVDQRFPARGVSKNIAQSTTTEDKQQQQVSVNPLPIKQTEIPLYIQAAQTFGKKSSFGMSDMMPRPPLFKKITSTFVEFSPFFVGNSILHRRPRVRTSLSYGSGCYYDGPKRSIIPFAHPSNHSMLNINQNAKKNADTHLTHPSTKVSAKTTTSNVSNTARSQVRVHDRPGNKTTPSASIKDRTTRYMRTGVTTITASEEKCVDLSWLSELNGNRCTTDSRRSNINRNANSETNSSDGGTSDDSTQSGSVPVSANPIEPILSVHFAETVQSDMIKHDNITDQDDITQQDDEHSLPERDRGSMVFIRSSDTKAVKGRRRKKSSTTGRRKSLQVTGSSGKSSKDKNVGKLQTPVHRKTIGSGRTFQVQNQEAAVQEVEMGMIKGRKGRGSIAKKTTAVSRMEKASEESLEKEGTVEAKETCLVTIDDFSGTLERSSEAAAAVNCKISAHEDSSTIETVDGSQAAAIAVDMEASRAMKAKADRLGSVTAGSKEQQEKLELSAEKINCPEVVKSPSTAQAGTAVQNLQRGQEIVYKISYASVISPKTSSSEESQADPMIDKMTTKWKTTVKLQVMTGIKISKSRKRRKSWTIPDFRNRGMLTTNPTSIPSTTCNTSLSQSLSSADTDSRVDLSKADMGHSVLSLPPAASTTNKELMSKVRAWKRRMAGGPQTIARHLGTKTVAGGPLKSKENEVDARDIRMYQIYTMAQWMVRRQEETSSLGRWAMAIRAICCARYIAKVMAARSYELFSNLPTFMDIGDHTILLAEKKGSSTQRTLGANGSGPSSILRQLKKETFCLNPEEIAMLTSEPEERTEMQLTLMMQRLQTLEKFCDFPLHMQRAVTRLGRYFRIREKRVILREGQVPSNFYLILSGQAIVSTVTKDADGNPYRQTVGILSKGEFFGEKGIIQQCLRLGTVTTRTEMQLLAISIDDYIDIFVPERRLDGIPEYIHFLSQQSWMQGFPIEVLRNNDIICCLRYFKQRSVIVADSTSSDYIYVVRSGSCQVLMLIDEVKTTWKDVDHLLTEEIVANDKTYKDVQREQKLNSRIKLSTLKALSASDIRSHSLDSESHWTMIQKLSGQHCGTQPQVHDHSSINFQMTGALTDPATLSKRPNSVHKQEMIKEATENEEENEFVNKSAHTRQTTQNTDSGEKSKYKHKGWDCWDNVYKDLVNPDKKQSTQRLPQELSENKMSKPPSDECVAARHSSSRNLGRNRNAARNQTLRQSVSDSSSANSSRTSAFEDLSISTLITYFGDLDDSGVSLTSASTLSKSYGATDDSRDVCTSTATLTTRLGGPGDSKGTWTSCHKLPSSTRQKAHILTSYSTERASQQTHGSCWARRREYLVPKKCLPARRPISAPVKATKSSVFVEILLLREGDVFGFDQLEMPTCVQPKSYKVSLVSLGAEVISIRKLFFVKHASVNVQQAVHLITRPFPSPEQVRHVWRMQQAVALAQAKLHQENLRSRESLRSHLSSA